MRADAKRILPLTGVRVLDLTNVIAGPVATRVLGNLGAEIIKIELPWGRSVGNMAIFTSDKSVERPYNKNAGFNEVNRAKRSISLDLADPRGKALFECLVSISDVVIENYSPRVMPNLGLTYSHLRTLRPDLIMVAMPALGSPGPWSNHISFGPGTEGLGGMCHVTGYQDGPPSKPGNFYSDQTSAFHVATAIMAAIWKRRRTGQGKQIEIVLRDVTMAVIGEYFLEYQLTGRSPTRIGNRHPSMAPHNVYRCKGDDAWVVIAVASDAEFDSLCDATGNAHWKTGDRFSTMSGPTPKPGRPLDSSYPKMDRRAYTPGCDAPSPGRRSPGGRRPQIHRGPRRSPIPGPWLHRPYPPPRGRKLQAPRRIFQVLCPSRRLGQACPAICRAQRLGA